MENSPHTWPEWVTIVLTAVGASIVAVLATLTTNIKRLLDTLFDRIINHWLRKRYRRGLEKATDVALILDQIRQLGTIDRVLWFVGENGGGIPTVGRKYTVRAERGWSKKNDIDVLKRYNFDLVVDSLYCEMLVKMMTDGKVINTVQSMPDSAILKVFYQDEGVKQAVIYYLGIVDNQLHYLSVASYEKEFTPIELIRVEMLIQRLRSLIN